MLSWTIVLENVEKAMCTQLVKEGILVLQKKKKYIKIGLYGSQIFCTIFQTFSAKSKVKHCSIKEEILKLSAILGRSLFCNILPAFFPWSQKLIDNIRRFTYETKFWAPTQKPATERHFRKALGPIYTWHHYIEKQFLFRCLCDFLKQIYFGSEKSCGSRRMLANFGRV